jgi:hypothetical protein
MVQCVAEAGPFDPAAVGSGACGLPWLITSRPGSRPVSWRPGPGCPGNTRWPRSTASARTRSAALDELRARGLVVTVAAKAAYIAGD